MGSLCGSITGHCFLDSYVPQENRLRPSLGVLTVSCVRVRIRINAVVTVLRSLCVLAERPSISETDITHSIQKSRLLVCPHEHTSIIQQKQEFDISPCENVEDILSTVDLQYSHTTLKECRSVTGALNIGKIPAQRHEIFISAPTDSTYRDPGRPRAPLVVHGCKRCALDNNCN